MSKIVLIDGHSILHRAFYGVPDLSNAEGLHTNAVYGFLNIMFKILDEEKPEYLNLSKEFFDGKKGFLEARVKMLYGDGNGDIISQYVTFTKIYQEQARLLGKTVEAVRETIRICKATDVFKE